MSKVFRLYTGGTNTYEGWNNSSTFPYNSTARDTIADPDGNSAKNEITSIPSPFARIDLVKTAFKEVCKSGKLDGDTIFHKMVSDSLDVGEIFFNIERFKQQVEIITWNAETSINALNNNNSQYHHYIADALEKYLVADAQAYNFGQMQNIYLLNYKNGPNELNIIGATSPATLFFSNANDLSYVEDIFFANNDKPFDKNYAPLYKRDIDYVKAWWTLRKTLPSFSTLFPEIDDYLTLTFKNIKDAEIKNQLNTISANTLNKFSVINIQTAQQSNQVEVLGHNLLMKKATAIGTSDFQIKPTRNINGNLPFVLPIQSGNKYASLQYVNGTWGNENKAPYLDIQSDITKRTLPYDGTTHPYLTISDFLEDNIICVPHALNNNFYYNGGISLNGQESYLLPIKPLLFRYFTPDWLKSTMPDGKYAFEIESIAGGSVRAIVRIPIIGNDTISYIEYQRLYYKDNTADASQNKGGIKTFDFTGIVMPSMRFLNEDEAYYTVSCVSLFSSELHLEFYKGDQIIPNIPMDCRHVNKEPSYDFKAETYTLKHTNFDFIEIKRNNVAGVLLPSFSDYRGLTDFEFSVDLGTSNTHIEYKAIGDTLSQALKYDEREALISTFFVPTFIKDSDIQKDLKSENDLIAADFIPFNMGGGDFSFPTRTAMSYAKTIDWTQNLRTFGLSNLNITYNKRCNLPYNAKPMVNIKWSNESNAQAVMQAYINNILLLIRNKTIANNGKLNNTQITWFYPNSMSPRRIAQLRMTWDEAYQKWFNPHGTTRSLSESVAPIQFYFRRYATATDLVNVDIGGGTTDIAFSSNGVVNYITSFRFAANSLFEDSFSNINPNNGIVDYFKEEFYNLLKSNVNLNELVNICRSYEGQPSNMVSFFFSLKNNSMTRDLAQNNIDFNKKLQNDTKFKLVFIIFYTAIIYHIAKIIKAKGLKVPRHIAFSGNGSKIINILSPDKSILENYTKKVFEQVIGCPYPSDLQILGLERGSDPKEATSKGGLIASQVTKEPTMLILKNSDGQFVTEKDTYAAINVSQKQQIIQSVKEFFHFVLEDMPTKFKFNDNFGVENTAFEIAKEECIKDLGTYLDKGICLSITESGDENNQIEEALSFYPIKGVLQALSGQLTQV